MYRTGDLARWSAGGRPGIPRPQRPPGEDPPAFAWKAGRNRGGMLARQPGVAQAVVLARDDASGLEAADRLCRRGSEAARVDPAALRQELGRTLPEYMVPARSRRRSPGRAAADAQQESSTARRCPRRRARPRPAAAPRRRVPWRALRGGAVAELLAVETVARRTTTSSRWADIRCSRRSSSRGCASSLAIEVPLMSLFEGSEPHAGCARAAVEREPRGRPRREPRPRAAAHAGHDGGGKNRRRGGVLV